MNISKKNKLYATFLVVALVMLGIGLTTQFITPTIQGFNITDTAIGATMLPSTIPTIAMGLISIFAPLSVLGIHYLVRGNQNLELLILTFFVSSLVTFAFTNILKVSVGELRPDFIERCAPVNATCSGDLREITEGRKSFPSGHTSAAFHGTFFIILMPVLKTIRKTFDLKTIAAYVIIALTFFGGSFYTGYTRYADHMHHIHDIVAGAILGTVVAMCSYGYLFYDENKKNTSTEIQEEEKEEETVFMS